MKMDYLVAVTLAIMAGLMWRSSFRVIAAFARRHDPRFFLALAIAMAVIVWLLYAAWWAAQQS